jgi:hypothetical protein
VIGNSCDAATADIDRVPVDDRGCREALASSSEDSLNCVESWRNPTVLVGRQRRPRCTGTGREIGFRQTSRHPCIRDQS